MLRLTLPMTVILLVSAGVRAQQDEPRAMVERALQAHGGAERLSRHKAGHLKTRGTLHQRGGIAFSSETFTQSPGRLKNVMIYTVMGQAQTLTQVLDGDKGWVNDGKETRPLDAKSVRELQETLHAERVAGLVLLREKGYELSRIDDLNVAGKPAAGVRVRGAGHRDQDLYFDKATGLLVSTISRVPSAAGGEVTQQKVYGNFKDFDGARRPTRVIVFRDGSPYLEFEVTELRALEKLPDATFAAP